MGEHEPSAGSESGADAALDPGLRLTETQGKILEALCRPRAAGNRYAPPATNQEIAGEVFLSVDAVKAHLRVLYRKFGVEDLPHNQKRARLVELVLAGGLAEPKAEEEAAPETPQQPAASTSGSSPDRRPRRASSAPLRRSACSRATRAALPPTRP